MAMHTWFECKIRYDKTMENGMVKKVTDGPIPCLALSGYAKDEPKMAGDGFDSDEVRKYAKKERKTFFYLRTLHATTSFTTYLCLNKLPREKADIYMKDRKVLNIFSCTKRIYD